jgi:hypothetical protein
MTKMPGTYSPLKKAAREQRIKRAARDRYYQVAMSAVTEAKVSGTYTDDEIKRMSEDAWRNAYGEDPPR